MEEVVLEPLVVGLYKEVKEGGLRIGLHCLEVKALGRDRALKGAIQRL